MNLRRTSLMSVAVLLALLSSTVRAQVSREIEFRPFSVSFSTRTGWDGGGGTPVFTGGQPDELESSPYIGFDASAALNLAGPETFLGSRTTIGHTYYPLRDGQDEFETSVNLNSTLTHAASPQWTISANHRLFLSSETQTGTITEFPENRHQNVRRGDYITSSLSIGNNFLLSPTLTLSAGGSYGITRYEEDAAANVSDQDDYGANVGLNYLLTSATSVGVGYNYSLSEHPDETKIFSTITNIAILVDTVDRTSQTHTIYGSFSHALSSQLRFAVSVGVQITKFADNNVESTSMNPYVTFSTSYDLDTKTSATLSYFHGIQETDIDNFTGTIVDTVTFTIGRSLTPRLSVTLRLDYSRDELDQEFNAATAASTTVSGVEESYTGEILANYSFTKNLGLGVGYYYNRLESDFSDRTFDRDRVYFNVNFRL